MTTAKAATFTTKGFMLQSGVTLPEMTTAYETYGDPANARDRAILLLHGYTSSPHAAGGGTANPGWWENLIGPGRAIDTDRYFVITPNMLGSCYGTTGPKSVNPETGKPYGPDFPHFTTRDMVEAHRLLIDHLGVGRLAAVVGYSYGGYLTYQWAVTFPDRMRGLVPVATGITGRGDMSMVRELEMQFEQAPGWNGGHFYDNGEGVREILTRIRIGVLKNYGVDRELRDKGLDGSAVEKALRNQAETWAAGFDPNSLIALRRCAVQFNAKPQAGKISAPLLYVLASSDNLFGPELGEPTVRHIREVAGVEASFHELKSPYGHRAPSVDWAQWQDALRNFLDSHAAPRAQAAE